MTFGNRFFASPYLYLPTVNGTYKRVAIWQIRVIETVRNYSNFKTSTGPYSVEKSLKSLLEILDPDYFCQVNRNSIVQLGTVLFFTDQTITLKNKEEIEIGPSYLAEFKGRMAIIE